MQNSKAVPVPFALAMSWNLNEFSSVLVILLVQHHNNQCSVTVVPIKGQAPVYHLQDMETQQKIIHKTTKLQLQHNQYSTGTFASKVGKC